MTAYESIGSDSHLIEDLARNTVFTVFYFLGRAVRLGLQATRLI